MHYQQQRSVLRYITPDHEVTWMSQKLDMKEVMRESKSTLR